MKGKGQLGGLVGKANWKADSTTHSSNISNNIGRESGPRSLVVSARFGGVRNKSEKKERGSSSTYEAVMIAKKYPVKTQKHPENTASLNGGCLAVC